MNDRIEFNGHAWAYRGKEDMTDPADRQWARAIWQCERCLRSTKVFEAPVASWAANEIRCPAAPEVSWWKALFA